MCRITLVRELGPVLTAVMVAGRNASGIASELGSMKVTEQIDAMRALGTDPDSKAGHAALDCHHADAALPHRDRRRDRLDRRLSHRRASVAASSPAANIGPVPGALWF